MRSRRIEPLLKRAQVREDKLAKELAERVSHCQQQEQRLHDLTRFRAEYDALPSAPQALSPALLQNRVAFRDRINAAVDTQRGHVDRSREIVEIERTRLLLASRDKLVLEKLRASYRVEEQRLIDRREQASLDELAGRAHAMPRDPDTP